MSKRTTKEELSAYLDGESPDAKRIEAMLRNSDSASRELAALTSISNRLRSLPQPDIRPAFAESVLARINAECADEVAAARLTSRLKSLQAPDIHPAFARRVVAAIESEQAGRPVPWRIPVSGSMLAAAAVALVVAVSLIGPMPATDAPTQVAVSPEPAAQPIALDETALLAQFEARVASDSDVQRIVLARFEPSAAPEQLYSARLLTALSGSQAAATGEAFGHAADYRSTLRRMDREQTTAVKALLEASVREAFKG
jgi:negative regulator of sigma E activity